MTLRYIWGKKELGHRFHSFINSKGIQLVTATQKVGCYVTNGYLQIIVFSLRGLLDVLFTPGFENFAIPDTEHDIISDA